jgi:prolyl-tRNA synthetase
MAHSDDEGLVMPPKIAPLQVVIVPIYKGDDQKKEIDAKAQEIAKELKAKGIRVKYDNSDNQRPGWKFAQYELKGVPVRVAIGARDIQNNVAEVARRDTREKKSVSMDGLAGFIISMLDEIHIAMFNKAQSFREENITRVDAWDEFEKVLKEK